MQKVFHYYFLPLELLSVHWDLKEYCHAESIEDFLSDTVPEISPYSPKNILKFQIFSSLWLGCSNLNEASCTEVSSTWNLEAWIGT